MTAHVLRASLPVIFFTPASTINSFADDPCDSRYINQGNVPATRAANCATDGIVQPFASFIADASQQGTLSGNPNLESEVAESLTFGVVLRPRFLDGFTMSVDWFDIEIDNAIESLEVEDIMIACYDSANFAGEPACDFFQRDAAGQVIDYQSGFVNVGLIEFTGIQTVISYALPMGGFGDMDFGLNHLFTDKHIVTPGSGNSRQLDGEIGESSHRVNLNATWYKNNWTVFTQIRWLDAAVFDNSDTEFSRDVSGVDDWTVVDTTVVYQFRNNMDVRLTIDNLFDNDAPFAAPAGTGGITTYFPGIRGRFATVTVRALFE